jgi:glutamine amidotransferase
MISIIDYGMGNLGSIQNMLNKLGFESKLESDPDRLKDADSIILPGVGAFDNAMEKLNSSGFSEAIKNFSATGAPVLGICLGMQLLATQSEEGELKGLNLIPGDVVKFNSDTLKVPHMGWNVVNPVNDILYSQLEENRFYFVHSFYYIPEDLNHTAGTTDYAHTFTSSVNRDNIFGVQFHPEKSHKYGMQLLTNFSRLSAK